MAQSGPAPSQKLVTELTVSANLMALDPGLYCVFHSQGGPAVDAATGLPGVRLTHPPAGPGGALDICTFNEDGWLGGQGGAALLRVRAQSHVLVTIYKQAGQADAPQLQVVRLGDVAEAAAPSQLALPAAAAPALAQVAQQAAAKSVEPPAQARQPAARPNVPREEAEVAAHIQRRGDVLTRLGEWMGEPGSQAWVEGFALAPRGALTVRDIEYQAVLGRGWLSPWSEGGQYCGSRGMALPILGLRVRLKGEAAATHEVRLTATFTDGTRIGPIDDSRTAEAESLAPLEAFLVELLPRDADAAEAMPDADDEADDDAEPAPAKRAARRMARGGTSPKAAPATAAVETGKRAATKQAGAKRTGAQRAAALAEPKAAGRTAKAAQKPAARDVRATPARSPAKAAKPAGRRGR